MSSTLPAADIKQMMSAAIAHHNAGRLAEADAFYATILSADPQHADALHLSGLVASQSGNKMMAIAMLRKAIGIRPETFIFHNNLGNILTETGQLDAALAAFGRVLELNAQFVPAHYNLGNLHHQAGNLQAASHCYERALEYDAGFLQARLALGNVLLELQRHDDAAAHFSAVINADPEWPQAHAGLGNVYHEQQRFALAAQHYRRAHDLDPQDPQLLLNLGNLQREMDDYGAAIASFKAAIAIAPGMPDGFYALACIHLHQGQLEQAITGFNQALAADPGFAEAHYNLGNAYRLQGKSDLAFAGYRQALALKPDFIAARWADCMAQIPIIYDSVEDLAARRVNYRAALENLSAALALQSAREIDAAAAAVGSLQPFFLAYQGQNDRDLQALYGALVCRILAAKYPAAAAGASSPARAPQSKLRIGFVSGFFYQHSNWKMPLRGWIENLDKSRFELFGYYTGQPSKMDDATQQARHALDKFHAGSGFDDLLQTIRDDAPDVLIYAEIGMDPLTVRLAGLRLAPVQCASWGHPDTSGMPTIDYYLSSALMEADDAERHYSEALVRLPNLSIHYTPLRYTGAEYSRAYFGLDHEKIIYLCAQSLFKYLPQYDDLFARIAIEVPNSQFVFLDYPDSPWLTEKFRHRLERAFARHGLRSADHLVICRHLNQDEYHGLNRVADIFLDSIGWSGCNSTLEAIACDLPVATMAGALMRGRHTLAILTMMGVTDTIASNQNGVIELAVRLGNDGGFRLAMSHKIAANKGKVYSDKACIKGLEDFLLKATDPATEVPAAAPAKTGFFGRWRKRA